ncbi:DUF2163 domain-containing protein [Limnohabitans lacus]|uniref:DUF2163 domain-containing protein n=1 Tax=Limnohabitans lacus TaxID=3045173 RepID=A0ABT6X860_9BURK|nr:DUF2163 domain-containing protein [Limnohabitans sp. HM2-2]MDI9234310.1 DUF2163 domain-containing protein [Limnohabitans sp. HM2-2]
MKTHTPELIALLNGSSQFIMADLYTITLVTGTVLRYTSADIDITHAGTTYSARGPLIRRGTVRTVVGLEVDQLDMTVSPKPGMSGHLLDGEPFIPASLQGALDGAMVMLQKAFLSSWALPPVGAVVMFYGRVSDVSGTRSAMPVDVKSALELLNTKLPRNIYQASCMHTLYDSGCAVNKAARTVTGTVTGTNGTGQWLQSGLAQAAGWFDQGVLTFTSGANAGVQRTVKAHSAGQFWFALPLPNAPAVGDAFSVYPGCDKTQATCSAKFNNTPRFRGFPFVPVPETTT